MKLDRWSIGRFLKYVALDDGCWLWEAATNDDGYGVFKMGGRYGKAMLAHRLLYELLRGPIKLQLDHTCRVRSCVNPWHLDDVTSAENTRRGLEARLLRRGEP